MQTEIPLVKQHLCDTLWAVRGQGAHGERFNRLTGERSRCAPRPSRAPTSRTGLATIARFFPGARDELAAIDDERGRALLGPCSTGKAHLFEDQYISTGGQLYELMMGHDRFDRRPAAALRADAAQRGARWALLPSRTTCAPSSSRARPASSSPTTVGPPLAAPLDVNTDVAWVGYANAADARAASGPCCARCCARAGCCRRAK